MNSLAKIALAAAKPSNVEMSLVATLPVSTLVSAILMPCSIKKVDRVTKKLGSLVVINNQPLTNAMSSASTSPTAIPAQTLTES